MSGRVLLYLAGFGRTWPDMSILDKSHGWPRRFGGIYRDSTWRGAIRRNSTAIGGFRTIRIGRANSGNIRGGPRRRSAKLARAAPEVYRDLAISGAQRQGSAGPLRNLHTSYNAYGRCAPMSSPVWDIAITTDSPVIAKPSPSQPLRNWAIGASGRDFGDARTQGRMSTPAFGEMGPL